MTKIIFLSLATYTLSYKPIIGIYGNSNPESDINKHDSDFVDGEYVRWFENLGAEVIAIHQWYTEDELSNILSKINGVLFQGGDRNLTRAAIWESKASFILDYCINNQLPIWGTCQGFQMISFLLSNNDTILENYKGDWGQIHSAEITSDGKSSKLFKYFNEEDYEIFTHKNSTIYFHNLGLGYDGYNYGEKLNELITVTSISKDKDGKIFINSFEGKNDSIKIFGTQFHPEKVFYIRETGFEKMDNELNLDCFRVSYKILWAFMDECYKNNNKILNDSDRNKLDFIKKIPFDELKGYKENFRNDFYQYKVENNKIYFHLILILVIVIFMFLFFIRRSKKRNENFEIEKKDNKKETEMKRKSN